MYNSKIQLEEGDIVQGRIIKIVYPDTPMITQLAIRIGTVMMLIPQDSVLIDPLNEDLIISKDENKFKLDNGMVITRDGFIQCPYCDSDILDCSIYLKGSCKTCGMNKKDR